MAIVYRHRRLDTFEVFYVGIGKEKIRAYCKKKKDRNSHWHNVVNKAGYEVEVIAKDLTWEEACELEIFLIKLYGREDLGTGLLVNKTDGGEGTINVSQETRKKLSDAKKGKPSPMKGIKRSQEVIDKFSKARKGKMKGENNHCSKLILNTETGIFYFGIREAAESYDGNYYTMRDRLNGNTKTNKTSYINV